MTGSAFAAGLEATSFASFRASNTWPGRRTSTSGGVPFETGSIHPAIRFAEAGSLHPAIKAKGGLFFCSPETCAGAHGASNAKKTIPEPQKRASA